MHNIVLFLLTFLAICATMEVTLALWLGSQISNAVMVLYSKIAPGYKCIRLEVRLYPGVILLGNKNLGGKRYGLQD